VAPGIGWLSFIMRSVIMRSVIMRSVGRHGALIVPAGWLSSSHFQDRLVLDNFRESVPPRLDL
jgi:hypothetical protein